MEGNALRELESFQQKNPDLSKEAQDFVLKETTRLQVRREELERQIATGGLPIEGRGKPLVLDAQVEDLLSLKRQLEADRWKLLPNFPPESSRLRPIDEHLRLVNERLKEVLGLGTEQNVEDRPKLEEQLQVLTTSIDVAMRHHGALASRLNVLQNLQEEYNTAKQVRKNYEFMSHEELDRKESTKFVQAQVTEKPQVAWLPYETYPYRQILYGCVTGLSAGCVLALLLELFRGTVRFRSDIEAEFPLRVIGVIPLR
jgi:uncharacterized protein involved in exopolysaccharide biosynthesis